MRIENSTRTTRLLQVREFTGKKEVKEPETTTTTNSKSRFVAPYYFGEADQATIIALLDGAGLGDKEGRQLFITATEYEVGAYRRKLEEEPVPQPAVVSKPKTTAQIELSTLGQSAEHLLVLLRQTHKTARKALGELLTASDSFGREYSDRYFTQLELELERISSSCSRHEQGLEIPEVPPISDREKKLITQLARIYSECLDVSIDADKTEVFLQILCIVRDSAEIDLPCDTGLLSRLMKEIT